MYLKLKKKYRVLDAQKQLNIPSAAHYSSSTRIEIKDNLSKLLEEYN